MSFDWQFLDCQLLKFNYNVDVRMYSLFIITVFVSFLSIAIFNDALF